MHCLHPLGDPGVRVLMMEPRGNRQHQEQNERDARERIADHLAVHLTGQECVPGDVGRHEPGVHDSVSREPKQRPIEQRVGALHQSNRPRENEAKEQGRDRE